METLSVIQIENIFLFQRIQFSSGTETFFIKFFHSESLRYGTFALHVATYLLQLDNLTKVSDKLPVFTSTAFVIGNPGLQ